MISRAKTFQIEKPIAVAHVVHGLNLNPDKMDGIAQLLHKKNIEVLRSSLCGHGGNLDEFKTVTRQIWIQEFLEDYLSAYKKSQSLGVPFYFVGYSLGTILFLDALTDKNAIPLPHKTILIATPLALRRLPAILKLLKLFSYMGKKFVLPSLAHGSYRATKGTPVNAYHALFDSLNKIRSSQDRLPNTKDFLLFLNKSDELVASKKIESLIKKNNKSWQLTWLSNKESLLWPRQAHLIIDEKSMGKKNVGQFLPTTI